MTTQPTPQAGETKAERIDLPSGWYTIPCKPGDLWSDIYTDQGAKAGLIKGPFVSAFVAALASALASASEPAALNAEPATTREPSDEELVDQLIGVAELDALDNVSGAYDGEFKRTDKIRSALLRRLASSQPAPAPVVAGEYDQFNYEKYAGTRAQQPAAAPDSDSLKFADWMGERGYALRECAKKPTIRTAIDAAGGARVPSELRKLSEAAHEGPYKTGPYKSDILAPARTGGDTKLFDVRGNGYYTGQGHGGLGMAHKDAHRCMDANADFAVAAMNWVRSLLPAAPAPNQDGGTS